MRYLILTILTLSLGACAGPAKQRSAQASIQCLKQQKLIRELEFRQERTSGVLRGLEKPDWAQVLFSDLTQTQTPYVLEPCYD